MVVGVIGAAGAGGCAADGEGTKTVTVEGRVTVPAPAPTRKKKQKHHPKQNQSAPAKAPEFVYCDPNIQARRDTTTCPFAENVFWSYWTSSESPSLGVWSPAAQVTFATRCARDGTQVTCTTDDGGEVRFSQAAVDRYSQTQADTYAGDHDLGPDPYEGIAYARPDDPAPEYDPGQSDDYGSTPGENIPNYDNGRGYRVQCEDGMYSQSGGIQGACSGHGGVAD
jgi:hypothetical protein